MPYETGYTGANIRDGGEEDEQVGNGPDFLGQSIDEENAGDADEGEGGAGPLESNNDIDLMFGQSHRGIAGIETSFQQSGGLRRRLLASTSVEINKGLRRGNRVLGKLERNRKSEKTGVKSVWTVDPSGKMS